MDLSIVIVTWRSAAEVAPCLASLRARLEGRLRFEVIVVDNASPDDTVAVVRGSEPGARVIENGANEGFARAANRGMREATGRWILLLNPDCIAGDGLPELVAWLDGHPAVGIATGWIVGSDGQVQRNWGRTPPDLWTELLEHSSLSKRWPAHFGRHWLGVGDTPVLRDVPAVSGMALFVSRALARELGGFDPGYFMYCEDFDLCWRARQRGVRIVRNPVATILHHGDRSARQVRDASLARAWPYQSMYRFLRTHRGAAQAGAFLWMVRVGLWARVAIVALAALAGGATAARAARRSEYRSILRRLEQIGRA